jgi:AcrR family transcriptional regulator
MSRSQQTVLTVGFHFQFLQCKDRRMAPYNHGDLPAALLTAAETILDRDGIGVLTMRATAREAGVSHAAPAHHFGDLSGLLTELAASGLIRFRDHMQAEAAVDKSSPSDRLQALGRGYVGFAQAHPGLFQLMFRSERLDWSKSSLATAGVLAFALLTLPEDHEPHPVLSPGVSAIVAAAARWSFAHGMAMLLIDGKLGALADKVPGFGTEALIDELVKCLALSTSSPVGCP